MALINIDWAKEFEQVNQSLSKLLDEKLEPMVDRSWIVALKKMQLNKCRKKWIGKGS